MIPRVAALSAIVILVSAVAPARAEFNVEDWEFLAPISIDLAATPSAGMVEMSLSPEVMDQARPSLADVRIIDEAGAEVPYVLELARAVAKSEIVAGKLYNRTFMPGRSSSATVDLGGKLLKNRIQVITAGSNFRRTVVIEGSDDGRTWRTIRRGALLFRIGTAGNAEYEKDVVPIRENDLQRLRVTVYNGAGDPEHVEITAIRVLRRSVDAAQTRPVKIAKTSVEQEDRRTILEFDLGHRHMSLRELVLAFEDDNFFRCVRVSGRQQETRIVKHPVEDAKAFEREEPEPWTPIRSGAVFRYSGEDGDESSLALDLSGSAHRHLRVEIANEDNPPLTFAGAKLSRYVCLVRFPVQTASQVQLYFGNARARSPKYDVAYYADRLASEGVAAAAHAEPAVNPRFGATPAPTPWSEKHRVILWLALLAGIAVLAALIVSQMRACGDVTQAHE